MKFLLVVITSVKEVLGDMAETMIVFIASVKEILGDTAETVLMAGPSRRKLSIWSSCPHRVEQKAPLVQDKCAHNVAIEAGTCPAVPKRCAHSNVSMPNGMTHRLCPFFRLYTGSCQLVIFFLHDDPGVSRRTVHRQNR